MAASFDTIPSDLMTVQEAAARLHMCERTVWAYALAGLLEPRQKRQPGKVKAARRITRRSVEAYVDGEMQA